MTRDVGVNEQAPALGRRKRWEEHAAPEEPNVCSNKQQTMRAPEERHQGSKSDAAPPELITVSIHYYKHWAPPEPRNGQTPVAGL